ncbi:ATP-binding cassette domain-containing protein [Cellulomonas rhizosphaerae]|uniref:ATP-binding cassette domain-containing protein n=1 Tax=Cellulomonas rhizosphaerae TaxID=2293719 RepID=UPI003898FF9A
MVVGRRGPFDRASSSTARTEAGGERDRPGRPHREDLGRARGRHDDGPRHGRSGGPALAGVTVDLPRHAFTAIMGPSGSGKSTLMQCIAGLDRLTSGHAFVGSTALDGLPKNDPTLLRRDSARLPPRKPWLSACSS